MADPTRLAPVTPRNQQLCLDPPCRTDRSADSGYGSLESSPTRPPQTPRRRLGRKSLSLFASLEGGPSPRFYDGNSSEESASEPSTHDELSHDTLASPDLNREKFATLPRVSRRRMSRTDSYPCSERKITHQRHEFDNTGTPGSSRVSSLRALDRFVPLRDHATPGSSKLRITKPLEELTPSERLVRHNQDAPDPFFFRRRALPPSPTEARKARRPSQSRTILDPSTSNQAADRRVVSRPGPRRSVNHRPQHLPHNFFKYCGSTCGLATNRRGR